jgi:hypothetical protein
VAHRLKVGSLNDGFGDRFSKFSLSIRVIVVDTKRPAGELPGSDFISRKKILYC